MELVVRSMATDLVGIRKDRSHGSWFREVRDVQNQRHRALRNREHRDQAAFIERDRRTNREEAHRRSQRENERR